MFVHTCTACERRQLMSTSQIHELVNTDHGIEMHFSCWCGEPQVVLTGRKAPQSAKQVLAA